MSEWKEIRLGDLCTFMSRGITPQYVDVGTPVINQKCIRNNNVDLSLCKFTDTRQKIKKEKYVEYGDILINSTGTGTLGRVAIYKHHLDNISADGHVTILHTNSNVNSAYLGYYLHSVEPLIESLGRGSTNQMELSLTDLKTIKIVLPPLDTQTRIANILSSYDDLIENNNRRIALLEKAAQELYKEWFVRFRFPGYENAKFENGLPEGWQVRRVGDISKIGSGGDAPKDYSPVRTPEYSVPIFSNGITNDGLYGFAKKGTKKAKSITISARGTVGFTCLRFEPYLPIVRLLSIEPDNKDIDVYYLYYNLRNDIIDGYGTSQQQITIPFFSKKKIIIPSMALQNQYAAIVEEIYNQINKLKDMNNNLVKQRDLLLPRLMSGKLEV